MSTRSERLRVVKAHGQQIQQNGVVVKFVFFALLLIAGIVAFKFFAKIKDSDASRFNTKGVPTVAE